MRIYHHNDLDGKCAGAIALRWHQTGPVSYKGIDLIEIDYKDKVDVDKIQEGEEIVIVDFSFKPEVMEEVLKKTKQVTWIDHHKTAFEYNYSMELAGLRDTNFAGCELAWKYYRHAFLMPRGVKLIGDYDKWALKFKPECFEFYEGMKLYPNEPVADIWDEVLMLCSFPIVKKIIEQGKTAILYRDNYCAEMRKSNNYEIMLDGHLGLALNVYGFGSRAFGTLPDKYDFCAAFIYDGIQWTVSLYSTKIDVSEICKKFGGGGHIGAAGFVCEKLPF